MTLHYVYVDSRNRPRDESINDFMVHLHTPIKNVVKCGVANFSKGNNSYNVVKPFNTITWTEAHSPGGGQYVSRFFAIEIPEGYYGINQLLTEITNRMNSAIGRQVNQESKTTYSFTIDDDYRVEITGTASTAAASNRWWGFSIERVFDDVRFNNSILHQILNFDRVQVLERMEAIVPGITTPSKWRQSQSSLAPALRSLKAMYSYTENQAVIHLASNTLAKHSQRMMMRDGQSTTMMTNVLEQIPVVVNRWSYIHLNRNDGDISWHNIDNQNINHFDLKILNEHYNLLEGQAESHWKACLVFETNDEPHHEIKEMYKEYNADAYRIAHRTTSRV